MSGTGSGAIVGEVRHPVTVEQAVGLATESSSFLAGGTWIMRGLARQYPPIERYIDLGGIGELRGVTVDADSSGSAVRIGASATHSDIAATLGISSASDQFRALGTAAATSAFKQVRNVATIGGNIAVTGFPDADLVPALLALNADLEIADARGRSQISVADYITTRGKRPWTELVVAVLVSGPPDQRSGFARLTVRGGGEYPTANAAACTWAENGIEEIRLVVGAVEDRPVRCHAAEQVLRGRPLDPDRIAEAAASAQLGLNPRDSLEAPGWYRAAVVPTVVTKALSHCRSAATTGEERS